MVDLHTHTNESDGTCTPLELVDRALAIGLEALAISDHDTFAGYDQAAAPALSYGLDLVCAIELTARLDGNGLKRGTLHLLGYFLHQPPTAEFRTWLGELQAARRERNVRLVAKLQSLGVEIRTGGSRADRSNANGAPAFCARIDPKGLRGQLGRCVSELPG